MLRVMSLVLILLMVPLAACSEFVKDRTQSRPSLERVNVPVEIIDVGDGDTVTIYWSEDDREKVRILGIDTPEVAHPHWGQYISQPLGTEAAAFAAGAFAAASKVELIRAAETDPYGRTLGYLFINGHNYSLLVLRAGFAVETVSHYGDNGLPEESDEILTVARSVAPVPFEAPYIFRKRMREIEDWNETHQED